MSPLPHWQRGPAKARCAPRLDGHAPTRSATVHCPTARLPPALFALLTPRVLRAGSRVRTTTARATFPSPHWSALALPPLPAPDSRQRERVGWPLPLHSRRE